MWNTASLWFEISVVTIFFLLGHIFLGHFEERSPSWRKLVKYIVTLIIILSLSIYFGRTVALTVLAVALIPVI
jgi:bacteriorhodopsin